MINWFSRSPFGFPRPMKQGRMTDAAKLAVEIASERRGAVKSMLFADDDPSFGQMISEWSTLLKAKITWARSNAEVMKLLETQSFDIAILYYRLMNCIAAPLYEELISRFPKTYVIFVTNGSLDEVSSSIHKIGPAPVYQKIDFSNPGWLMNQFRQLGVELRSTV